MQRIRRVLEADSVCANPVGSLGVRHLGGRPKSYSRSGVGLHQTSSRRLLRPRVRAPGTVLKRESLILLHNRHTRRNRRTRRSRPIPLFPRARPNPQPLLNPRLRPSRQPQLIRRLRLNPSTPESTATPAPVGTQAPSSRGSGVLLAAITSRNVELVETLVEAGFPVNAKDDKGNPVLFIAIVGVGAFFSSNIEASERIVQILVNAGADVKAIHSYIGRLRGRGVHSILTIGKPSIELQKFL